METVHVFLQRYYHFFATLRDSTTSRLCCFQCRSTKTTLELNPTTSCEITLQVNHLSTTLLSILMLSIFKEKNKPQQPGCITIVGSEAAAWCEFKEQDSFEILTAFNDPKLFDMQDRYTTSKLLSNSF